MAMDAKQTTKAAEQQAPVCSLGHNLEQKDVSHQIQNMLSSAGNFIHGYDADESNRYSSIIEWKSSVLYAPSNEKSKEEKKDAEEEETSEPSESLRQQWYKIGHDYYEDESNCPATVDGVLGGFAHISQRDLKGSREFIKKLQGIRPEFKCWKHDNGNVDTFALECGAGIGRVSKGLLFPLGFTTCDLVEPSRRLLSHAPDYIGSNHASQCRYFCVGLQDFTPQPDKYNLIFIQWVIGYMTDDDLVMFLRRCAVGLRKGGVVIIKDNTCSDAAFVFDRDDSSVTRSLDYILAIVQIAALKVVLMEYQVDFPKNIFPVPMIALSRVGD